MKHLLTVEVESVSDNKAARVQLAHLDLPQDGHLQAVARCCQDRLGNGSLAQVHGLGDGVDNDAALWNRSITTELDRCWWACVCECELTVWASMFPFQRTTLKPSAVVPSINTHLQQD